MMNKLRYLYETFYLPDPDEWEVGEESKTDLLREKVKKKFNEFTQQIKAAIDDIWGKVSEYEHSGEALNDLRHRLTCLINNSASIFNAMKHFETEYLSLDSSEELPDDKINYVEQILSNIENNVQYYLHRVNEFIEKVKTRENEIVAKKQTNPQAVETNMQFTSANNNPDIKKLIHILKTFFGENNVKVTYTPTLITINVDYISFDRYVDNWDRYTESEWNEFYEKTYYYNTVEAYEEAIDNLTDDLMHSSFMKNMIMNSSDDTFFYEESRVSDLIHYHCPIGDHFYYIQSLIPNSEDLEYEYDLDNPREGFYWTLEIELPGYNTSQMEYGDEDDEEE